jgi:hypothetical protein
MSRKLTIIILVAVLSLLAVVPALAKGGRAGEVGLIYVTSQGLYYETFATADTLPMKGPFQKLEMGPNGSQTEFGPGDPGYLGGRWWVDANNNNLQDASDTYFLCPLLGPGIAIP